MEYPHNPNKVKDSIRLLQEEVDLQGLHELLSVFPDDQWETKEANSVNPNKKGIFLREASHITLKFTSKQHSPFRSYYSPLWEKYSSVLLPFMEKVVQPYAYEEGYFPIVMFAKLPPQRPIIPHVDGEMIYFAPHKIHVPICTNDQTFFFVGKQRHHFEVGKAYEVDNINSHGAINGGNTDRIHLIFEYMFGKELSQSV